MAWVSPLPRRLLAVTWKAGQELERRLEKPVAATLIDVEQLAATPRDKVVGQDAVCVDVGSQIRRRLAMEHRTHPVDVFLFAGPPPPTQPGDKPRAEPTSNPSARPNKPASRASGCDRRVARCAPSRARLATAEIGFLTHDRANCSFPADAGGGRGQD